MAGVATGKTRMIVERVRWLLADPDRGEPVVVGGDIDRIDRLPSGGIAVIDYKTGRTTSQKGVDDSLQLSIYALACRDALGLGTPEKVTLYFTDSATRIGSDRTVLSRSAFKPAPVHPPPS